MLRSAFDWAFYRQLTAGLGAEQFPRAAPRDNDGRRALCRLASAARANLELHAPRWDERIGKGGHSEIYGPGSLETATIAL